MCPRFSNKLLNLSTQRGIYVQVAIVCNLCYYTIILKKKSLEIATFLTAIFECHVSSKLISSHCTGYASDLSSRVTNQKTFHFQIKVPIENCSICIIHVQTYNQIWGEGSSTCDPLTNHSQNVNLKIIVRRVSMTRTTPSSEKQ